VLPFQKWLVIFSGMNQNLRMRILWILLILWYIL